MSDPSTPPQGVPPVVDDAGVVDAGPAPTEQRAMPHPRPPRPGDLSLGWRAITAGVWIGVVVGLAAVWNASVQLGLSTWWLGPRAEPRPTVVQFTPFVAPVLMLLATINQIRWLAWWGLAAAAVVAGFAAGDIGRVSSLAVVEFTIAGAAALVSIASFTGTYRAAEPDRSTVGPAESASADSRPPTL